MSGMRRTSDNHSRSYWTCRCDCGNMTTVERSSLVAGATKSCGCLLRETVKNRMTTHGHASDYRVTPEYKCWRGIKQRCLNKNDRKFALYGGRGISICDRWKNSFEHFLEDVGFRPTPGHSIDRINTNGNYEPTNCRWATISEQNNNMNSNRFVEFRGQSKTITQWSRIVGIRAGLINYRIRAGWSPDEALTEKPKNCGP
jgi:hypothetical protein